MKSTFFVLLALLLPPSLWAQAVPKQCEYAAASLLESSPAYVNEYSDVAAETEILFAYNCARSRDRRTVACLVSVSKAGGQATDTWQAVLDPSCTNLYGAVRIGEE